MQAHRTRSAQNNQPMHYLKLPDVAQRIEPFEVHALWQISGIGMAGLAACGKSRSGPRLTCTTHAHIALTKSLWSTKA